MRQPRTKANAAGPHTPADVELIRASIETMNDGQIAAALGWKIWKVVAVRALHEIPAHAPKLVWSKDEIEVLKARYIKAGEPASIVGAAIGRTGVQVAKKANKLGLKRDPRHAARNRDAASIRNSPFTPGHSIRRPRASAPAAAPATVRRQLTGAAVIFMNPVIQNEPLGGRILRALADRPMSAQTIATVVGEKELYVSQQLSAFAREGRVTAGEGGPRERRWSLAA